MVYVPPRKTEVVYTINLARGTFTKKVRKLKKSK